MRDMTGISESNIANAINITISMASAIIMHSDCYTDPDITDFTSYLLVPVNVIEYGLHLKLLLNHALIPDPISRLAPRGTLTEWSAFILHSVQ